ncbi:armadillo-type protein [Pavlovales sp. CCMP2436]|nr:armadillo-type protein [Pavlovales sp. CCMP2436]
MAMHGEPLYDAHTLLVPVAAIAPPPQAAEEAAEEAPEAAEELIAELIAGSTINLVGLHRLHAIVWRGAGQPALLASLRAAGMLELAVQLVQEPNLLVRKAAVQILWALSAAPSGAQLLAAQPLLLAAIIRLIEKGAFVAEDLEILVPPAVSTLRNIALAPGAHAALVAAGAVGALLHLLLGTQLAQSSSTLVDVMLVLWKLSATASTAATTSALSELCADSVLKRLSELATRTAAEAEVASSPHRRRLDAAVADENDDDDPVAANAAVCALLCNIATEPDVAERAGAHGAVEAVCASLRAGLLLSNNAAAANGAPLGQSCTVSTLHAVWALANLLSLSRANCKRLLSREAGALGTLTQLLAYEEPPTPLVSVQLAAQLQTRNTARFKAALALRCATRTSPDAAALRVPGLVRTLVRLLGFRATESCHGLALQALIELADGRELLPTRDHFADADALDAAAAEGGEVRAERGDTLEGAREVAAAGALAQLRHTFLSAERDVLEGSMQLLGVLCALPEIADELVPDASGGIDAADGIGAVAGAAPGGAQPPSPSGLLPMEAARPQKHMQSLREPPTLDSLLALLGRGGGDRRLARQAVRVLRTVLLSAPPLRAVVGACAGAVDSLLRLTVSADERTQLWACSAVHLLVGAEAGAASVCACGGIPILLELLKGDVAVRSQAAQALGELCRISEEAAMGVDKAAGVLAMSEAIKELYRDYRPLPFY